MCMYTLGDLLDFEPLQRTVSVPLTATSYCFNVIIIDDQIIEASENFIVSFTINSPSTVAIPGDRGSSTIVTITDNDGELMHMTSINKGTMYFL